MKRLIFALMLGMLSFGLYVEKADAGCICPRIYKPVCGANGKTYSNACVAKCAKIPVKCANKCPCKRPCPVFRLKKPAPGCKYFWYKKNGCKYPRLICSCKFLKCKPGTRCIQKARNAPPVCVKACPVFKLKQPPAGCKYFWYMKNGCKYPRLVCSCKLLKCKPGTRCLQTRPNTPPRCVRCPVYKLAPLPKGCRYVPYYKGGCRYFRRACSCSWIRCKPGTRCVQKVKNAPPACVRACPVFKLRKPPAGCKYVWYVKNGCKYPRLVCSCKLLKCKPGYKCVQSRRNAPPKCVKAGCLCTKIYRPVCGTNNRTYGNACMANCARVKVKCQGKCPCKR